MKKEKFYLEALAEFYSNLQLKDIPENVIEKAKMVLLDYIFVYIVGYHKGTLTKPIIKYAENRTKNEEATILIKGAKTDIELSAMVASLISHSVELDDGHRYGTAHPAVVVIPAALAMAEKQNATYAELLKAIIIGYDFMLRLSRSINPAHLKRGFHSTSTTGTIGSAAAVASLLNFNKEQTINAVSIAGLLSSGLQEMLHGNPSIKSFQAARSCQSGVLAAQFVTYGGKGPSSLFEGQHGWLKAMTDAFDENALIGELGERWEIVHTYTKLYPTCRHCHHAIDLAIDAYNDGIRVEDIKKIKIKTYTLGILEVGQIRKPDNLEDAMFSIFYAISIALKKGFVTYEDLEEHLFDEKIHNLHSLIEIEALQEMDEKYPMERGCVIDFLLENGQSATYKTKLPKGEPETKLSDEDYLNKFKKITKHYLHSHEANNIFTFYQNLLLDTKMKIVVSTFLKTL